MPLRYYFRERIIIPDADAGENNLDDSQVKPGRIYYYEEISVENRTHAFTRALFGVESGEDHHYYEEQQNPAADTLYPWHCVPPLRVLPGEFVRVKCTGVTLHDELIMFVAGYFEKEEEQGPEEKEEAEVSD